MGICIGMVGGGELGTGVMFQLGRGSILAGMLRGGTDWLWVGMVAPVTNIEMKLRLNASAKPQDLIICENFKCIEVGSDCLQVNA